MSKPSSQQNQIQNSKETTNTIQNSKEIPIQNSKVTQDLNSKEVQNYNSKEAQIQNSKEIQNQNSKEITEDVTKGNGEFSLHEKDENKLAKEISEQEKKDQEKGIDNIANQNTESDKQEKKDEKQKMSFTINILGAKKIDSQSKKKKENKKKKPIKIEKKENSNNYGGHESNTLLENKYSNPTICKEKNKLLLSDFLNKKRKREIKIDEKYIKLKKTENLGGSFGKSFGLFDNGDDARYRYKGVKKKVKYFQIVKYKLTENSKGKLDFYQEELMQSENIYLFPIHIDSINIIPDVIPDFDDSSDEEIHFDIIRNMSANHQRNNIVYSQNVIMNNHNDSLSYLSTNEKTIQF